MIAKETPLNLKKTGRVDTVAISELPGWHSIDLRVAPGSVTQSALADALGIELTAEPGQAMVNGLRNANEAYTLRLGPDWWLITGNPDTETKLAALRLENDHHFSAVDVSDQRTVIELEGPHAPDVLAHLWEQDLREKSFPAGRVSQGLMAKAPVIVWHVSPLLYRVMVRRSFSLHVWAALTDAAAEWI